LPREVHGKEGVAGSKPSARTGPSFCRHTRLLVDNQRVASIKGDHDFVRVEELTILRYWQLLSRID
jgi:hypothetical protein